MGQQRVEYVVKFGRNYRRCARLSLFGYFAPQNKPTVLLSRSTLVILGCLLGTLLATPRHAQGQHAPKYEMRAAWIATVANIDWPSRPGLPVDSQKAEFTRLVDMLKAAGMNAVVVQIRPAADAFYASSAEPWSYWLTGRQGQAPAPYYDPLSFMIAQTHARGMEFHAWFNPYRAVQDVRRYQAAAGSVTRLHPGWFLTYGTKRYFNPGLPEVWHYLVGIIGDVVRRYDVDGVQFDDYFYPYRIRGRSFPDDATYRRYGAGRSQDDWRRHNVDTVISMVSRAIKKEKPWVKFGISPFGVWRNRSRDPEGSLTQAGQTDYDDLYADVLLWLKEGWIDYVCPQLYWEFGNRYCPYEILLDWWSRHSYGRQLYIGQGAYRIGSSAAWNDPSEMPREIRANRTEPAVGGSIWYSASVLARNPLGILDSLSGDLYHYPALPPPMPWIDSIPPAAPQALGTLSLPGALMLEWKNADTTGQATQFIVYRFSGDQPGDFDDPAHILGIVNLAHGRDTAYIQTFLDRDYVPGGHYVYAITALDRLHNESVPSGLLQVPVPLSIRLRSGYPGVEVPGAPLPLRPQAEPDEAAH